MGDSPKVDRMGNYSSIREQEFLYGLRVALAVPLAGEENSHVEEQGNSLL